MKFTETLILLIVLSLGWNAEPAFAQTSSSNQVQLPPSAATTNPVVIPAPSSSSAMPQSTPVAEDIHDIRGLISIPSQWLWILYLAGGLAIATALYAAWRLFRQQAVAKSKLPYEIALERLEAARALMTVNAVREYAFTVSEIIRVYIEQRFGEMAARRTTEEFLFDLLQQTGTPLAQHRRQLEDFLSYCDLMKFARWQASVGEMESMLESARAFILDTRPQAEPAKPAAPAQSELLHAK